MAGGNAQMDYQTCIWKPRPLNFAGTLPEPPTANRSQAYSGWTSGTTLFIISVYQSAHRTHA